MVRHTDSPAMEQNRAALPTPPAYAGEIKGTFSRKEILSALVAADSPAAIPALFAQLREMGVGCVKCKKRLECRGPLHTTATKFLCNNWEGK